MGDAVSLDTSIRCRPASRRGATIARGRWGVPARRAGTAGVGVSPPQACAGTRQYFGSHPGILKLPIRVCHGAVVPGGGSGGGGSGSGRPLTA